MRILITAAAASLAFIGISVADPAAAAMRSPTNISAQQLGSALRILAADRHLQILYTTDTVGDIKTGGAIGDFTTIEALDQLLGGTGLTFQYVDDTTITILDPMEMRLQNKIQHQYSAAAVEVDTSVTGAAGVLDQQQAAWPALRLVQADTTSERPALNSNSTGEAEISNGIAPQEIMVSARRLNESIVSIPESISVLGNAELEALGIHSFEDYGLKIPNLSFQYGGSSFGYANNREVTIRGIAGNNTTGFYIDDTQVPMALDPQVVDVQRIEVLKGPQGTLYGAGSMGGNVRVITQQPKFNDDFGYTISAGHTDHSSSPDGRVVGIGNLSVIDEIAALRAVAVIDHKGGFITRTFSDRLPGPYPTPSSPLGCCKSAGNQGAASTFGGSVTLLVQPMESLSIKARLMGQGEYDHGRAVQYAPLPTFEPFDSYIVHRQGDVQERVRNHWFLPSLELTYRAPKWSITSSTSYFGQRLLDIEDGTEGDLDFVYRFSKKILSPVCCGDEWPSRFSNYNFNQELRLAIEQIGPFRAIVGARYGHNISVGGYGSGAYIAGLSAAGIYPTDLAYNSWRYLLQTDKSVFGETYWRVRKFELTLGARKFVLSNLANIAPAFSDGYLNSGSFASGYARRPTLRSSENGVSPKAALSYDIFKDALLYASASKGFRPGGANRTLSHLCDAGLAQLGLDRSQVPSYHSDDLWNYEIGGKARMGRALLTIDAFQMNWTNIQSTVIIPVCLSTQILNNGDARVRGGELELSGSLLSGLEGRLGFGYQQSELLTGGLGLPKGSAIQNAPKVNGSVELTYTRSLTASLEGFASSDFAYTGSSISNTTGGVHERGGYGLLNARLGVHWDRYQLELYGKNLTNRMANMGDLFLNAQNSRDANGVPIPVVVIPRPLQIGVQFMRSM